MSHYENRYECRECDGTVRPSTYRATCPDCGGTLRATTSRYGDRTNT